MSNSPKKKKNKKGHKKKNVKEEKDALLEVDRTMYNIQIADLTEKLGRYCSFFHALIHRQHEHSEIKNSDEILVLVRKILV